MTSDTVTSDAAYDADSSPAHRDFQFSLRRLLYWMFLISLVMAVFVALAKGVRTAQRDAIAVNSASRLCQLSMGLRNYHEIYGCLPPAYVADEHGKPMHSWRVLILPFIEQQALYNAYDFSEPWNGPKNSQLANQMPVMFCSPSEVKSTTFTNFVVIKGPGTAFPGDQSTKFSDFADGTSNTILLTEIANSRVPWLEPVDIDSQKCTTLINDPAALSISSAPWRLPFVVLADGIPTYGICDEMPPDVLRALTTIAGGEPIERSRLIDLEFLDPSSTPLR